MSLPPLPPGATLDEDSKLPPLPEGATLDAPQAKAVPSAGDVALRGFAQGASMGFSDELAGAARALASLPKPVQIAAGLTLPTANALLMTQAPDVPMAMDAGGVLDAYRSGRREMRQGDIAAQKDSPWLFGGSSVVGSIMGPGPKGAGAQKGLAKAATLAKQGAAFGSASGLGSSDADLTDFEPKEFLEAGLSSLGGGAVGGIMAPAMGVAGDKLRPLIEKLAANNALKAIGLRAGISDQLGKRGYETADEARELGKAALDMELIRPFRTASDVAERAGFAKEVQGARISQALADADAAGPFDAARASWQAAGNVMGPAGLTTEAMSKARPATKIVERIAQQGEVDPSFSAANRLKSDIYSGINYARDPALSTQLQRRAAGGLRSSIEEQVSETAGRDVADELVAANRAYGALQDIQPLAQEEATRQLARSPWYSPGNLTASLLAGGAGMQVGGSRGAAAGIVPLAAKALGPRIPSAVAAGANALAPLAPKAAMGAAPAIQAPLKPSLEEREQDAISEFLSSMP